MTHEAPVYEAPTIEEVGSFAEMTLMPDGGCGGGSQVKISTTGGDVIAYFEPGTLVCAGS